ncbi:MAG: response regulator, partial [Candidatus Binatia bacterium]
MNTLAKILVVDDTPRNVKLLADVLNVKGYAVVTAASGREALAQVEAERPDLILLDIVMPEMSGYEVCRKIRENPATNILPVIMVTALDPGEERVKGIEAGADDFLTKPINQAELLARVKSLLRIKKLHDTIQAQTVELSEWNKNLELRVQQQVQQLERLGRLKRFFSPQLAELIVAGGAEDPLKTHRTEVTVVFLDLRGFTAFAETSEPEEVMRVLREYHAEMGKLILDHEGTLERFTGDGMMIFFNDPVPVPNPAERAIRMALAMRERVAALLVKWRKLGFDLDFGVGIAQGYATIGAIGFEGRWDYGAIGTV